MSEIKLTVVTAEGSLILDPQNQASIDQAVHAIMQAQVNSDLDDVPASELSDEEFLIRSLHELAVKAAQRNGELQEGDEDWGPRKYGTEFENDVFEMHPFWWGRCRCKYWLILEQRDKHFKRSRRTQKRDENYERFLETHEHAANCPEHPDNDRSKLPNFRCGDFEVRWYKYIGRDISCNRSITRQELEDMFKKCFESLVA